MEYMNVMCGIWSHAFTVHLQVCFVKCAFKLSYYSPLPPSPPPSPSPSDQSSELSEALKRSQLELANTLSELNTLRTTYTTAQVVWCTTKPFSTVCLPPYILFLSVCGFYYNVPLFLYGCGLWFCEY